MRAAARKTFAELATSFGSAEEAHAFAEVFTARTGGECCIAPLVTAAGEKTEWFRLSVPQRLLARAEDIRYGYDRAYWAGYDALHGVRKGA